MPHIKEEILNVALDKWKTAHEALLGLGLPLEDYIEAAKLFQREVQDAMTPEEKEEYNDAMITDFKRMMAAMDEDIADLRAEALRKKMGVDEVYKLFPEYIIQSQVWYVISAHF